MLALNVNLIVSTEYEVGRDFPKYAIVRSKNVYLNQ